MDKVHALKEKLLEVCELLKETTALGYQVQFQIQDGRLSEFKVLQEVKMEQ